MLVARSTGLVLFLALSAPPLAAQDTSVDQIGERSTRTDTPAAAERSVQPAAPQLSSTEQSSQPNTQLTRERGQARAGPQLNRSGRTAEPPAPLSRPSEGRTGVAQRIGGKDRCDNEEEARSAACQRVIETRSAEFSPPEETPLSPEQRLLVDQRLRAGPLTAQNATRRSSTGLNPDSLEEQSVASIALGATRQPSREEPAEAEETLSAEAQALINAIVQGATGTPP